MDEATKARLIGAGIGLLISSTLACIGGAEFLERRWEQRFYEAAHTTRCDHDGPSPMSCWIRIDGASYLCAGERRSPDATVYYLPEDPSACRIGEHR